MSKERMGVPDLRSTQRFYEDLTVGRVRRGLWSYEKRFDPARIADKRSVQRHFVSVVSALVSRTDRVLDLGCGPGGFLKAIAPYCGEIVGVDVVPAFVDRCQQTISDSGLRNASARCSADGSVPFEDARFDVVLMVDTLHHCERPREVLADVQRVLTPAGRLIVFEPNKFNPLLALMCALDRNEWGLLKLGSRRAYRKLLAPRFVMERCEPSGLLVGPESAAAERVADFVSGPARGLLGWLSPKLFFTARPHND